MKTIIPILDLIRQYSNIKEEIDSAIKKIIKTQQFILGKEVIHFENEMAKYCGTKYAVGVASGTDALLLSLHAVGIKRGDEVITTPFTFFATAEAISIIGATPVFVDIEPRTYNINPALIEKKITRRTKAIIPVHLYGQCADMNPIQKIAKKFGLKVIEDCAQAIGATYRGTMAGSLGDIAALSFFPSKNLGAFGDAGMVLTNSKYLAEKVRILRVHGSKSRYRHSIIGYNSRIDDIQAAVLRIKLRHLDSWLEARRRNAEYYSNGLEDTPLILPYEAEGKKHTYHLYVLRVRSNLKKIMNYLINNGIETRTYYPVPLHLQKCYKYLGYKKGDYKETEGASHSTFAVGVYPELKRKEQEFVISKIKDFFKK